MRLFKFIQPYRRRKKTPKKGRNLQQVSTFECLFPAHSDKHGQGSKQLQIKLPSTVEDYSEDEEEEDDDDQRPFTREELKMKSIKGIQNKQKRLQKKITQN